MLSTPVVVMTDDNIRPALAYIVIEACSIDLNEDLPPVMASGENDHNTYMNRSKMVLGAVELGFPGAIVVWMHRLYTHHTRL